MIWNTLLGALFFLETLLVAAGAYVHMSYEPPQKSETQSSTLVEGKKLYRAYKCHSCHGPRGAKPRNKNYPYLAGQSERYLTTQVLDIQAGRRQNGLSSIMQGQVSGLTEVEIEKIASYLAAQPGPGQKKH